MALSTEISRWLLAVVCCLLLLSVLAFGLLVLQTSTAPPQTHPLLAQVVPAFDDPILPIDQHIDTSMLCGAGLCATQGTA